MGRKSASVKAKPGRLALAMTRPTIPFVPTRTPFSLTKASSRSMKLKAPRLVSKRSSRVTRA